MRSHFSGDTPSASQPVSPPFVFLSVYPSLSVYTVYKRNLRREIGRKLKIDIQRWIDIKTRQMKKDNETKRMKTPRERLIARKRF